MTKLLLCKGPLGQGWRIWWSIRRVSYVSKLDSQSMIFLNVRFPCVLQCYRTDADCIEVNVQTVSAIIVKSTAAFYFCRKLVPGGTSTKIQKCRNIWIVNTSMAGRRALDYHSHHLAKASQEEIYYCLSLHDFLTTRAAVFLVLALIAVLKACQCFLSSEPICDPKMTMYFFLI